MRPIFFVGTAAGHQTRAADHYRGELVQGGQFYALIYMLTVLKLNYVTVYTIMMVALTIGSLGFIFFGWLSDQIGREYTMALAFFAGACALFTLSQSGSNPVVSRSSATRSSEACF